MSSGIYPLTIFWGTLGKQWQKFFPGIEVISCCASIIFYLPLVRELSMWVGARDGKHLVLILTDISLVSKRSLEDALSEGKSILLVPGGEREMRESKPCHKETVLVSKRYGFIRLALKHGAHLVPIFTFGETHILTNIRAPRIQEWFQKRLFYGFPHFPYGRWFSPIPRPYALTMAVGTPISVSKIENPTEEDVLQYHKLYFDSLVELFEKTKVLVPGYEDCKLVLKHH
jgi:hypothetical protein